MAEIVWSPRSLADLEHLIRGIEHHAPVSARRFAQKLVKRIELLADYPMIGSFVPEDDTQTYREIIQGNYRAIYRMADDTVLIIAIHHAARLLDTDKLVSDAGED